MADTTRMIRQARKAGPLRCGPGTPWVAIPPFACGVSAEDQRARTLGPYLQRSHIHSCRRFAAFWAHAKLLGCVKTQPRLDHSFIVVDEGATVIRSSWGWSATGQRRSCRDLPATSKFWSTYPNITGMQASGLNPGRCYHF